MRYPAFMPRRANRLAEETSPYLLQHAHNPVNWFPWGPEALERAKKEQKPVLLSIGYAACHWCHVMEKESFDDEVIAAQMNESFVCIKVDREERPDLDDIYMNATMALSGSGGWPMTVFLTPEGEPFFAGTYFPPEDRHGRPGFPSLLGRITEMWKKERSNLTEQARQLTDAVQKNYALPDAGGVSEDALRAASRNLGRSFDESFGGFGRAPKFPAPTALSLLLRTYRRTGQKDLLHMVTRTLDGMSSGGMYDQLGGGFARYSVDHMWLVPHFEKMLYDNAQLADVYVEGFQVTGYAPYRRIARETLEYLIREMQSPSGGFFSAMDADSEGVEGKYYVFSRAEVQKAVGGAAATHFCEFYGITDEGNFDGHNILTARRPLDDVAKAFGIDRGQLIESLETGRQKLLEYRSTRVAPAVDDKIVCGWNGLVIRALSNAARAFSEPSFLEAAMRAADFVLSSGKEGAGMRREDGGLFRTARAGKAHLNAYLEDYAYVADGLICLYEASGETRYLNEAVTLTERMLTDFSGDDEGALFLTDNQSEALISRPRGGADSALPSANAVACLTLGRLAVHAERPAWRARASKIAAAFAAPIKRQSRAFCGMLCAVDFLLEEPLEIALAGDPESESYAEMSAVLGGRYLPNRVEARIIEEPDKPTALTQDRFSSETARTFVCQNFICQTPAESSEQLDTFLKESQGARLEGRLRELGSKTIDGRASREGTTATKKLPAHAYTSLGDLSISRLGVGSQRVGLDDPNHRAALRAALSGGLNLIDTSPSFAFGDSERLIGEVLSELCGEQDSDGASAKVSRESLVVVSKVGVAFGAPAEDLERTRKTSEVPHACPIGQGPEGKSESLAAGAFCLNDKFLSDQIESSLERLNLAHLDVCLIQSPEHFLAAGKNRDQLEEALLEAFTTLERQVSEGRIGRYGVLCNTLARGRSDPIHIDLSWLLDLAKKAAGDAHHFQVIELPINIVEQEALSSGLADKARDLGLSVLATRPLSPMLGGALLRLVDPPEAPDGASAESIKSARYTVASLEAEFETTFAAQLRLAKQVGDGQILPLSGPLGQALEQTATRQQFELAETTMLTPRLRHLLSQLDRAFGGDQKWAKFREKYVRAVGAYLAAVREVATEKNRTLLAELGDKLKSSNVFQDQPGSPWAARGLKALLSHKHVTGALVGLRSEDHVRSALSVLSES